MYLSTVIATGNRCGHNSAAPRWFGPPPAHAPRPAILRRFNQAVRRYYPHPRATLPELNGANGSPRQQRSERREACLALLGALVHYLDLPTLRVGIPQSDGAMAGIPMHSTTWPSGTRTIGLAERAGLSLRRAERALRDLVRAGLAAVHPRCHKLDEVHYQGFAAIRTLTPRLFAAFGLDAWLAHERRKASERRRQRDARALKQARKALVQGMTPPPTPPPVPVPPSSGIAQANLQRMRAILAGEAPPPSPDETAQALRAAPATPAPAPQPPRTDGLTRIGALLGLPPKPRGPPD